MFRLIKRDFYSSLSLPDMRNFRNNPTRELIKIILYYINIIGYRISRSLGKYWIEKTLIKKGAYARGRNFIGEKFYIKGKNYFEIQIGNETRTVSVSDSDLNFSFEIKVEKNDHFIFGVAPLLSELESNSIENWELIVIIKSLSDENNIETFKGTFPYGGRSECFAFYPDDGWIDFKTDLEKFTNQECSFMINVLTKNINSKRKIPFSVSNPHSLKNNGSKDEKNILLISGESLTDINFLKSKYLIGDLPHLTKLCDDSVVYPQVYSPSDNTLSYSASLLSGLSPSQHGIGNYSIMPWSFNNEILNTDIVTIPRLLKENGFFNTFAGTETRLSSKVGWAMDFDHYFHVFNKWEQNVPKVDWINRAFDSLNGFNKFIMIHLDYLHEPLVSFTDTDKPRFFDLNLIDKSQNDETESLYIDQLNRLDNHIGLLIQHLKSNNKYDNTAIIITGDHGCGINWVKHCDYSLYEERIRVPLIIKYPNWANNKIQPSNIVNSNSEIFRVILSILGEEIPFYFKQLNQYRSEFDNYAFSETIMNPNKEFKSHKIAIMNSDYKYVAWNKINWAKSEIEKRFIRENLFSSNNYLSFDEGKDLSKEKPEVLDNFKEIVNNLIKSNIEFHSKYPPVEY